ncbi:ABC transporter substrate-binding protein [Parasutterella excrementihominis]|uniref:ABC transporter substrate-binding protein n=2 Tax=Parasutterella excrementihominis TaxID=487175 RepID=UPI003AF7A883
MRRLVAIAMTCAAMGIGISSGAYAATFKWASQGDILTFDPHAQNEAFNNTANSYVYEALVNLNKGKVTPSLAESWTSVPEGFVFKLRKGVKFHEGETLTAEDVAFSINRALHPISQFKTFTAGILGAEALPNGDVLIKTINHSPVLLNQLAYLRILNKAWAEKHGATAPQNFVAKEEAYAAKHANGTGPFKLQSREVDIKTVFVENPDWWNKANKVGNVTEGIYTPIKSAATRMAALLSGEVDFVPEPATQDIQRLKNNSKVKLQSGPELRVLMISLDQMRDESPYVFVDGKKTDKNPFKDIRVRQALYQAIDIKTLQRAVMRGFSIPNGTIVSSETNGWSAKAADRLPYDPQAAKKLLAEAGYPNGFEFTLDCPNNRYINDEAIGKALAGMWAKIGVKVKVNAIPRANYFPKVLRYDSSVGMVGWGASTQDALFPLQSLVETVDVKKGNGLSNIGRVSDPELDALIEKIKEEENFDKRNELIEQALLRVNKNIYVLPLHTQVINWALKKNIDAPLRADDRLELDKVVVKYFSFLAGNDFSGLSTPERMPTDVLVCYKTSAPGNIGHAYRDLDCFSVVPICRRSRDPNAGSGSHRG